MVTCTIIGVLVNCLITTPPSPDVSAAILRNGAHISMRPIEPLTRIDTRRPEPQALIPAQTIEPRRLDGTPYTQPPIVYRTPLPRGTIRRRDHGR